ncbi:putative aspartic-type endopeptidase [Lachnellula subtilissima]|uniref:Putative aspartic-type endopeptidase n=1 Tax=Lachnellula subtilissima TaxID=602034 RepID=A0A8H8RDZ7_9HELO|nr:putative aspartic-type endopeptidase [Lachnellula subtilissima]
MLLSLTFPLLALGALLPIAANNAPEVTRDIRVRSPIAFSAASPLVKTTNYLTLGKKDRHNPRAASSILAKNSSLISLFGSAQFDTNVTFGDQTFELLVDTGSSDTWVIHSDFTCVSQTTSALLTQAACASGPAYTKTPEFVQIPDENFNITYGDGEFLTGILGYENLTLAGITVNTTIPIVDFAAWDGDDTSSGLLGLGYPNVTRAYVGTDPHNDSVHAFYDPIFTTMYKQGLVAPMFSLAIERDLSGPAGYLALGGLPPVDFMEEFTSTPIVITRLANTQKYPVEYDFYSINMDAVVLDNVSLPSAANGTAYSYLVDSGTTLNYFPTELADAVAAAYNPPAIHQPDDDGTYYVDCNATAPGLGLTIGGTTFWTNPIDMIQVSGTDDDGNDICVSGIYNEGSDPTTDKFVLGCTFFQECSCCI